MTYRVLDLIRLVWRSLKPFRLPGTVTSFVPSAEKRAFVWMVEITVKRTGEPVDHFVCLDQRLSVEIAVERTRMYSAIQRAECEWVQRYIPVFE